MLVEWNQIKQNYISDNTIQQIFEAQVEKNPERIALVFNKQN